MTRIKSASFTRYTKVLNLLQADPLLRKKLGKEMVAICRPDQTSQDFPKEVVCVVEKIHQSGLDAGSCTTADIKAVAFKLLVVNTAPLVLTVAEEPAKDLQAEEPDTPDEPVAKKPAPKKISANKKPSKVVEPAPVSAKATAKVKTAPKSKATSDAPPAGVAVNNAGEAKAAAEKVIAKVTTFIRPGIPYVVGCAILANIQAALSLLEAYAAGGDTEAKEICQRLNALIDDIHRRTIIPSAKENPETTAG